MGRLSWVAIGALCALGLTTAAAAEAPVFRPFTEVTDVCPRCGTGPRYDRVELRDGTVLRVRVLAENSVFYVLERFGEQRAASREEVRSVTRNPNLERPPGFPDQILFKDGSVLAGTLGPLPAADQPYSITVPPSTALHLAPREAIRSLFHGGHDLLGGAR